MLTSSKARRGGDSNPRRRGYRRNGFRDRRIQPLCHLSAAEFIHCVSSLQPRYGPYHHVARPCTLTIGLLGPSGSFRSVQPGKTLSWPCRDKLPAKSYFLEPDMATLGNVSQPVNINLIR